VGTITLILPSPGQNIAASLHSTNYAAIQAVINAGLDGANLSTASMGAGQAWFYDGSSWVRNTASYYDGNQNISAANTDIPWVGSTQGFTHYKMTVTGTAGTIRSLGTPKYAGQKATLRNGINSGTSCVIKEQLAGGTGVQFKLRDGADLTLNFRESVTLVYSGSFWLEIARNTSAVTSSSYGTSLPGSPTDGQEYTLVDSTTSPTYQWRFRYNAGSSNTDKWEFVGGVGGFSQVATAETLPSAGSYVALSTAGPSFALPRAGVYIIEIGAKFNAGAASHTGRMSYDIGGTGAVDADSTYEGTGSGDQYSSSIMRAQQKTGLTAVTLTAKYKATATSDGFEFRWMKITPVRVS
jgi:hypothetical protein